MHNHKVGHIERPKSLCDIAAETIRATIISGQYGLGEALSENTLTEALGISKTPIREALALLKHEGLVTVVPQKGTFVFTMSVSDIAQLGGYRYALETAALDRSMRLDKDGLIKSLLDICHSMSRSKASGEISKYLKLDGAFHNAIFEFCGNKYLVDGYQAISNKTAALRTHLAQHPTHTDKSFGEHREITQLLQDDMIQQAKAVLKRHVTRGERTYADGIEDIATASAKNRKLQRRKKGSDRAT